MSVVHKIESTESEMTICKEPVLEETEVTLDWFAVTCSPCAQRRPEDVTWVPFNKAFEKDDD
jgi:hypothetical protein